MEPPAFPYTQNNFFRFGYDGDWFRSRESAAEVFTCDYDPQQRAHGNFREECIHAARLVAENFGEDLWIAFSGGVDSEVCLRAFVLAGLKPRVVTLRFAHGINAHDVDYTHAVVQELGVEQVMVDLDLADFWAHDLDKYSQIAQCTSPQFPLVMHLMETIPGLPVVGSGDSTLKRASESPDFYFYEEENYVSLYRYCIQRRRPAVPAFFQYTPELVLAFLKDPLVQSFVEGAAFQNHVLSIKHFKGEVYARHFPLTPRPVYDGYEKVKSLENFYRKNLEEKFPKANSYFRIPYEEFVTILEGRNVAN